MTVNLKPPSYRLWFALGAMLSLEAVLYVLAYYDTWDQSNPASGLESHNKPLPSIASPSPALIPEITVLTGSSKGPSEKLDSRSQPDLSNPKAPNDTLTSVEGAVNHPMELGSTDGDASSSEPVIATNTVPKLESIPSPSNSENNVNDQLRMHRQKELHDSLELAFKNERIMEIGVIVSSDLRVTLKGVATEKQRNRAFDIATSIIKSDRESIQDQVVILLEATDSEI